MGFTAEPPLTEIVEAAHAKNVPVIHDLGGGVLVDLREYSLPYEPLVQESIEAGVDIVTFSGDKILGGPQSGIIVGKEKYINKIKENPLLRALRCGKMTLAVLEPTLRLFFQKEKLLQQNHVLRMMAESEAEVETRAQKLVNSCGEKTLDCFRLTIENTTSQAGSGALPLEKIPSRAVVLNPFKNNASKIAGSLRKHNPAIVGYIQDKKVYLDMRTVSDKEIPLIAKALVRIAKC
jgi:L-seryl-tRNA(Ser) seleniumtransferase